MAHHQHVARKGKKTPSEWEICYGCGNQCKGSRGLKIHYLHSATCLNFNVPVDTNNALFLDFPSTQPPSPHVERIRQSAPAEVFNRLVGTSFVVEDRNVCDDDLDFGSFSNEFDGNNVIPPPYGEAPNPGLLDDTDEIGDSNAAFPDSTIMEAFKEYRKSGKACDVSYFPRKNVC